MHECTVLHLMAQRTCERHTSNPRCTAELAWPLGYPRCNIRFDRGFKFQKLSLQNSTDGLACHSSLYVDQSLEHAGCLLEELVVGCYWL